ncbi:hypothetical protein H0H81_009135 [Sphagnurus paluster]|uniref:Uncharacterized protein n=1 Tax=Sphagnurus paluster TaxID=117069 RepID=A0A9P7FWH5_9AGAR|nr:hypothetical protein H0H81_009135 [Sphagnurus paluster]
MHQHPADGIWDSTAPSSPATSTSTLALGDDEIKTIFDAEKPNSISSHDPGFNFSVYSGATPDLSSLRIPLPAEELNPHAMPFVPKIPPKSRCLVRPPPGPMTPPRISRWLRNFNIATKAPIVEDKEVHTLIVVCAEAWDPQPMAELAQEICWRVGEATPEDLEAVLVFMIRLYARFVDMKSQEIGDSYARHVREMLLGTFISAWDAKSNPEAISYTSKPSAVYVKSAVQLARVIGELYARGFVDYMAVTDSLETLVANFVAVEHADAIAAIVQSAGPSYWFNHPDGPAHLHRFTSALTIVAGKLRGEMSVLDTPRSEEQLDGVLSIVDHLCREWSAEMAAACMAIGGTTRPPPSRQHSLGVYSAVNSTTPYVSPGVHMHTAQRLYRRGSY